MRTKSVSFLKMFFTCFYISLQVWFQNRRSKERRMKQLSALGARRHHFFRNPRRMRPMRGPYDVENSPDMMGSPPFNYPDHGRYYFVC